MWIFTQDGYVSAVQKRSTDTTLEVRARDRQSLQALVEQGYPVVTRAHSDYPFRVIVPQEVFADFVRAAAMGIDYSNFKDKITKTRGHVWHDALMNVWVACLELTPAKARKAARTRSMRDWDSRYGAKPAARGNTYQSSLAELQALNGGGTPVSR
jgi:hypothetical protein